MTDAGAKHLFACMRQDYRMYTTTKHFFTKSGTNSRNFYNVVVGGVVVGVCKLYIGPCTCRRNSASPRVRHQHCVVSLFPVYFPLDSHWELQFSKPEKGPKSEENAPPPLSEGWLWAWEYEAYIGWSYSYLCTAFLHIWVVIKYAPRTYLLRWLLDRT